MRRLSATLLAIALVASIGTANARPRTPAPDASASADPDALPALAVDPGIADLVRSVSARTIGDTDRRLVAFGTRSAFSERLDNAARGVFAARDWIRGRFEEIAQNSDGRMTVALDTYEQPKSDRAPRAVEISSVYATLRGDDPTRETYVISSHYDSRNSDPFDAGLDAPGADDNGSATAAVIEAARVMAHAHFAGTIIFACFDGEEQGLFGSGHFAQKLAAAGVHVAADFNNDIIGASVGHDGEVAPYDVRLFSEALPSDANLHRVNVIGTENDSPSRELARFALETDQAYVPSMHVNLIYRADRFLRGGDQESFTDAGFPAIRFVEQNENFDHQHQNVRTEGGVEYGDLVKFVDFDYVARVTQLNVAALATAAAAPSAPVVTMDAKALGYTTSLSWPAVKGAASYDVLWRKTYEPQWTHARSVTVASATIALSKDDWIFGVRSVDDAGHRSVVSLPTPVTH
jgi:hypothetical protein